MEKTQRNESLGPLGWLESKIRDISTSYRAKRQTERERERDIHDMRQEAGWSQMGRGLYDHIVWQSQCIPTGA